MRLIKYQMFVLCSNYNNYCQIYKTLLFKPSFVFEKRKNNEIILLVRKSRAFISKNNDIHLKQNMMTHILRSGNKYNMQMYNFRSLLSYSLMITSKEPKTDFICDCNLIRVTLYAGMTSNWEQWSFHCRLPCDS
jgi:hypothetical protein